jgi:HK97 family phage portal protein
MGLFDRFLTNQTPQDNVDVKASLAPFTITEAIYNQIGATTATRSAALSIPTIARAHSLISSTLASLPIEQYNKFSGAHEEVNRAIAQPDPRVPGAVIYSYIASDLFMYGIAYGQVMDSYSISDGSRVRAWTRIDPTTVSPELNNDQTEIIGYRVRGLQVPNSGIGSLIVFNSLADEGLLNRAGRTIRAALELEKAAEMYAKEPVPTMVLKSNGTNLTPERITKLLESWKVARGTRSTAFLNADVELQALGFDPAKLQLNEARQYVALELARACGISAYFVSAEMTSMTYSNATTERRAFIDFTLKPLLVAIEKRLSMPDFVPSITTEVRFDLDDFLRGNPLERAQVYEILNRIGAMSVEQIQEEEDLIR